ncbi:MAG: CinA family nicotinamide mononucleotide deamidase-related protein [Desulfamplus sp.]|nr:CinA family nicotinamide mononucleotide deamidase-related protein [Desulfamplus sp.]
MKAEILSTGDEVLWGDIDDTNSSWLSRKLRESDIEVLRISCVGDSIEDIARIIKEIATRADSSQKQADIVLVTGGLGPTSDDLSAEAAALASGDIISLNQIALDSMKSYFSKRDWILSDDNIKQAMLPSRAGVMENFYGTAPGFHIELGKTIFFFMPGVPREMKPMYEQSVLPIINKRFFQNINIDSSRNFITRFKLFGLSESKISSKLKGFNEQFPNLKLGFRASIPLIEVKFSGNVGDFGSKKESEFNVKENKGDLSIEKAMADAGNWVSSRLGDYIFSYTGLNMEQELGRLLTLKQKTVAVAESCTGGLIGSMLTDVAGSSSYFLMSAVTYSNEAKINILGVNPDTLIKYGAVHEETAKEMAQGVMNIAGADYGVATSGIAGPGGGSEDKPVGTICIGVAGKDINGKVFTKGYRFQFTFGDRAMNKKMFAVKAMDILRREII